MINWILNLIGIAIYFISKYANRNVKAKFNRKFWLTDNWPEVTCTLLFNIGLMIILLQPTTQINIDNLIKEYVPFMLQLAVKPLFAFGLGLGLSSFIYAKFKKFKREKK